MWSSRAKSMKRLLASSVANGSRSPRCAWPKKCSSNLISFPRLHFPSTAPSLARRLQTSSNSNNTASSEAIATKNRGEEREKTQLQIGDRLHGYKVEQVVPIPERNFMTFRLVHERTGAQHFHVDCSDTNNVFSVTFKTIPHNSTGVAHILEHTTLCGSKKYPVRDPFFNMLKRSLNTYMNAYTASDHTSYPFSTQNVKDYYNLMSVYLDATFFPKLEELDFMQEGHRLEFEKAQDASSPLQFKGVVYNEMKGAMSEGDAIFAQALNSNLYSKTTYTYNSGGDPKNIPDLTYEQLLDFHKRHYHPSNARFYTYGDLPLAQHLQFINENVLAHFYKTDPGTDIPNEHRLSAPKRVESSYPPIMGSDPNRQHKFSVAWLTNKTTDPFETMAMNILSRLLLNGPNAPMHKSLIDTNIGLDYAPSTGYDSSASEAPFSVGLSGISEADAAMVEEAIIETLKHVANEGFPEERIESILHQIELSQKHITSDFGMTVGQAINSSWIHGTDPAEVLSINKNIERLRKELAAGPFFQEKVKKYFLENQHQLALLVKPDEQYLEKLEEEERNKLQEIRTSLSQEHIDNIVSKAKTLKERQEQIQDVSILPTLHISDIPREAPNKDTKFQRKSIAISSSVRAHVSQLSIPQPTNGVTYFRGLLNLDTLSEELQPYIPLFCSVMGNMGAGEWDYRQLAQAIETHTGGVEFTPMLSLHHSDLSLYKSSIYMASFCLDNKMEHMFDILRRICSDPKFEDTERLKSIIFGMTSDLQESLVESGHSYARSYASSAFSRAHALQEIWSGMSQVSFMQQLAQKDDFGDVIEHLKAIADAVLDASLMKCSIVAEDKALELAEGRLSRLIQNMKNTTTSANEYKDSGFQKLKEPNRAFIPIPASVNFVVKCLATVPYTDPDFAKLRTLSSLLSSLYLHTEIREKGGAYGGGSISGEGLWSYYSYRDPNTAATLDVYDRALDWINSSNSFTDKDIDEAKMKLFSSLDHPLPPSSQGLTEFTSGVTYEIRQKHRGGVLDTNRRDLIEVANKYLSSQKEGSNPSVAIFGNEKDSPFGTAEEVEQLEPVSQ